MNWPELILGAAIGAGLSFAVTKAFESIGNRVNNSASKYVGAYFCYYYSSTRSGDIIKGQCQIARNRLGQVVVHFDFAYDTESISYHGQIRRRDDTLYIHVHGRTHVEEVFMVFPRPVTEQINQIIGVVAAIDMRKNPYAGKLLLSAAELTTQKCKRLLGADECVVTTDIVRTG